MRRRRNILLGILLLGWGVVHAQTVSRHFSFYFQPNSTEIDSACRGNAAEMAAMADYLRGLQDGTVRLQAVVADGETSPEGSEQLNDRLADERMDAVVRLVRKTWDVPEESVSRVNRHIGWAGLREQVAASDLPEKEAVLRVLDEDTAWVKYHFRDERMDARVIHLLKIDNGRVWSRLKSGFFPEMRKAGVVFVTDTVPPTPADTAAVAADTARLQVPVAEQDTTPMPQPAETETVTGMPRAEEWQRQVTLKTNAVGWALALVNMGVEADIAEHWSVQLPVYWSSWNYFKATVKLRAVVLQPEVRYWFSGTNDKWFAGAHFGVAWYNVAWDGKVRIQDQGWGKPGLGGGLTAGYRMPLSQRNPNWKVEFSLGAGVYAMRYDIFRNYKNGLMTESGQKAFFCIDHAAVSFSYSFDTGKKGGAR